MAAIPRSLETDGEDVVWALETAEALWRRDDHDDALIWLARAIAAAEKAHDSERAVLLQSIHRELEHESRSEVRQTVSNHEICLTDSMPSIVNAPPPLPLHLHGGIDWTLVEALADLPTEAKYELSRQANVDVLGPDEELRTFGLALVLRGHVDLCPMFLDALAKRLDSGSILLNRGYISPSIPLRLIATEPDTAVASWNEREALAVFADYPTIFRRLRTASDQWQSLVGLVSSVLGDRLDAAMRSELISHLSPRVLEPGAVLVELGQSFGGLVILGTGSLTLAAKLGSNDATLSPGDVVLPQLALAPSPSPTRVTAGSSGAIVYVAPRAVAQELILTVPSLLEVLSELG